jgi:Mce-associated membrane protein
VTGADTEPTSEQGSPALAGHPALAPSRRRLLLVLAVVGLLLLPVVAVLGVQLARYDEREDRRQAAIAAAKQSALNLTSIDVENFDEDVRNVLEGATGPFRADFERRAEDLEQVLSENEVSSEGEVIDAGLVRFDPRNATALVVVDSTVRNTAAPEGRVNTYRMQLELEYRDGRWLTSMLQFVG